MLTPSRRSCLTIKKTHTGPSPADVARSQGKGAQAIKEKDVPKIEKVDSTGRIEPTKEGLLKRRQ
jgi:hypothetical protein